MYILLMFVLEDSIDGNAVLVQVMVWHQKTLPKPLMTHIYDAIWHHLATMSLQTWLDITATMLYSGYIFVQKR